MSDFNTTQVIKKTRKSHECEQCGGQISSGSRAIKGSGQWGGYMYSHYQHPDCYKAGIAYAKRTGCWDDDFCWFQHMWQHEDDPWLIKHFPTVAKKLLGDREEIQKSLAIHMKRAERALAELKS